MRVAKGNLTMPHAIVIHRYGGPEVLTSARIDLGEIGANEVRLRHTSIGLNFRDIHNREGRHISNGYGLPLIIGGDGAGVIEAVGRDVKGFRIGQRVAYGYGPLGSYSEVRNFPVSQLIALPDDISEETAAAMLLKGFTAYVLINRARPVLPEETILVHAVAGGTGLLICQLAKLRGAHVIGTVGALEKAEIARAAGCDEVILLNGTDVAQQVRALTAGKGVSAVFDGIGKSTFEDSVNSLRVGGTLVAYGDASGELPKIDSLMLMDKGSLNFSRVKVRHYLSQRSTLDAIAADLFTLIRTGQIKVHISRRYALREAAIAHRDFQARKTFGSVVFHH